MKKKTNELKTNEENTKLELEPISFLLLLNLHDELFACMIAIDLTSVCIGILVVLVHMDITSENVERR